MNTLLASSGTAPLNDIEVTGFPVPHRDTLLVRDAWGAVLSLDTLSGVTFAGEGVLVGSAPPIIPIHMMVMTSSPIVYRLLCVVGVMYDVVVFLRFILK